MDPVVSEHESWFWDFLEGYEDTNSNIQDTFSEPENYNQAHYTEMASSQECIQPTIGPYAFTSTDVSEFPVHEPGHYENQKSNATTAEKDIDGEPPMAQFLDRGGGTHLNVEAKVRMFLQGASQAKIQLSHA